MEKHMSKTYRKMNLQMSYREYRQIKNNPLSVIPMYLDKIDAIMTENIEFGQHLYDEVFIPEYLGFKEVFENTEKGISRFYIKKEHETFIIFRHRVSEKWMFKKSGMVDFVPLDLPNMFVAIITLQALDVNISIVRYIDGEWVR